MFGDTLSALRVDVKENHCAMGSEASMFEIVASANPRPRSAVAGVSESGADELSFTAGV